MPRRVFPTKKSWTSIKMFNTPDWEIKSRMNGMARKVKLLRRKFSPVYRKRRKFNSAAWNYTKLPKVGEHYSVSRSYVREYVRANNMSKIISCSRISVYRKAFTCKIRYPRSFFSDDANWPIREIIAIKRASYTTLLCFSAAQLYARLHVTNATKRACIRINARS